MTAEEVKRLVSILEKIVDTKIQKYALRENHLSPIAFEEKNMKHYTHGMYVDHILFRKFLHEVDLAQDRLKFFETLDELPDATTADTESLYFVSGDGSLWYIEDGEYKLVNSITDVPLDNKIYGRKNGDWSEIDTSAYINDSPSDGFIYGRKDGNWEQIDTSGGGEIKAYASERVNAVGGSIALKLDTKTIISNTLTNNDSLTITLPTPRLNFVNESILTIKIGSTVPNIILPTITGWYTDVVALAPMTTRTIVFEQLTFDGINYEVWASCDKQ